MNLLLAFIIWVVAMLSGFYNLESISNNPYLPIGIIHLRLFCVYVGLVQFYFMTVYFDHEAEVLQTLFMIHCVLSATWGFIGKVHPYCEVAIITLILVNALVAYWRNYSWKIPSPPGVHASTVAIPLTAGFYLFIVQGMQILRAGFNLDLIALQYCSVAVWTLICLLFALIFQDSTVGLIGAYMIQCLILEGRHGFVVPVVCEFFLLVVSLFEMCAKREDTTPLLT